MLLEKIETDDYILYRTDRGPFYLSKKISMGDIDFTRAEMDIMEVLQQNSVKDPQYGNEK
jgi:hypothetical protein